MKLKSIVVFLALSLSPVLYFTYALDRWLGVLAFKWAYVGISAGIALLMAVLVFLYSKQRNASLVSAVVALALMLSLYVLPASSSRVLREIMLTIELGTQADNVEAIILDAYATTRYAPPIVTDRHKEIHVSLASQAPGDVTGAIFHLENGQVVGTTFVPD